MNNLNASVLETVCREFFSASKDVLSWEWDDRFETCLALFSVDTQDRVRTILERYLNNTWDKSSIGKAPKIVQQIASDFGGIKSKQLLLTSDTNQDAFVFGAWWPWNDGKTITIRIAPLDKRLSDSEMGELIELFKGWFGL